jgi:hypothetical protein
MFLKKNPFLKQKVLIELNGKKVKKVSLLELIKMVKKEIYTKRQSHSYRRK